MNYLIKFSLATVVIGVCVCSTTFAGQQASSTPFFFEVATIKPAQPGPNGGGGGGVCHGTDTKNTTSIPLGHCGAPRTTLKDLILLAHPPTQPLATAGNIVTGRSAAPLDVADRARIMPIDQWVSGGPGWIGTDLFELDAKAEDPAVATVEQLRGMLQTLLRERFKLAFHMETRDISGYFLVPAQGGLKLKPVTDAPSVRNATNGDIKVFPMQRGNLTSLALIISLQMKSPVLNTINTPDQYDFSSLSGVDIAGTETNPVGGSIFSALQEKLGLKLEPRKIPVQIFVVDHAEKPGNQ
jgi:uncharacterized protein (TIGR03435 family)